MSDVEDIQTVSFVPIGSARNINFQYTETSDGVIYNLCSNSLREPAIINGKQCTPDRRYTKASLERVIKAFVEGYKP